MCAVYVTVCAVYVAVCAVYVTVCAVYVAVCAVYVAVCVGHVAPVSKSVCGGDVTMRRGRGSWRHGALLPLVSCGLSQLSVRRELISPISEITRHAAVS